MRFLVDESVGDPLVAHLQRSGHDLLEVSVIAPRALDIDILAWAVREDRVVITSDKDFGELVFRDGQAHRGVILLRLRDESEANQIARLDSVLHQNADLLLGRFIVITDKSIRFYPRLS